MKFKIAFLVGLGAWLVFIPVRAQKSSDAIAVRVVSNPQHYRAELWYREQGFRGTPQNLLVNGYRAVRDGRTVYVNAANVMGGILYTNIYLLSFNQQAEWMTEDIFAHLLQHLRFNTNYSTANFCDTTPPQGCLETNECPEGYHCFSQKAKIVRDTWRLEDINYIRNLLEKYYQIYGRYPCLQEGSFIKHKTVSVWPSWNQVFGRDLGAQLPVDPINKLGDCPGYDSITCWNQQIQQFADANPATPRLDLPAGSSAYVYEVSADCRSYTLYGTGESGLSVGGEPGFCVGSGCGSTGGHTNNRPVFNGYNLKGFSGHEFKGFFSAQDADGDSLKWSIDTSGTAWSGWSAPPQLRFEGVRDQRTLWAERAGVVGLYPILVTIDDGRGLPNSVNTQTFVIQIYNQPPIVVTPSLEFPASTTNYITYMWRAYDDTLQYPLSYAPMTLLPDFSVKSWDKFTVPPPIQEEYRMIIDGTLNNAFRAPNPKNYFHFDIVVTDAFGASTPPKRVTWTITNNPPAFRDPLGCAPSVRISRPALGVNNPYPLCDVSATDPEGNVIVNYRFLSGVNGLSIDSHTGVISGAPTEAGLHTITIEAEDEFGAIGSASYNLKVNTYCGDKVYQGLNDEGETEDCDHTDNIASGPVDSAVDRQYQCSSACRYMGGYCGDGRLQVLYGEECDDGNRTPGDWCDEACQKESVCGDGVKEGIYEECDDGNTQDCDGCSHLCEVELNSTCVDNPPALPAAPFYDSSHPQSSCGPNTRSAACAGAPANALWNTVSFGLVNSFFINQTWNCTAGKWLPSNRGLYGGPSDIHCRFVCGPGYDYDSVNGVCVRRCCIFDASAFDCFICL